MVDDQSGQCQFGADDHPQNCAKTILLDFSTSDVQPKITGVWDIESAGDEWTGDNAFFYSFTMFCRKFDINVFDYGKFCEGKETGTFEDEESGNTVECNNDELGGGWIKVFELNDPLPTMGSAGPAIGNTPLWYSQGRSRCNQYLFIDQGTETDFYAPDPNVWSSQGYDFDKHVLTT